MIKLHRIDFGITTLPPRPLDLGGGFTVVSLADGIGGRVLAIVEDWEDATAYCRRVFARRLKVRRLYVTTYGSIGGEDGQPAVICRWRADRDADGRMWMSALPRRKGRSRRKNPWKWTKGGDATTPEG